MGKSSKKSSRKASAATAAGSSRRRGQQYPVLPRAPREIDAFWLTEKDFEDEVIYLVNNGILIKEYVSLSHFDGKQLLKNNLQLIANTFHRL
jgi:hypothetical protein